MSELWPALSVALIIATSAIRRYAVDPILERATAETPGNDQVKHLRTWIPVTLAMLGWVVTVVLPVGATAEEAASVAALTAIGAVAGHDVKNAVKVAMGALARLIRRKR